MRFNVLSLLVVGFLIVILPAQPARAQEEPRLWVYAPVNFQVDEDVERLIALLKRAKQAGYNGAAVTDYKFGKLDDDRPARYYRNLTRTREAAEQLDIELIPLVMQIGYSNSILQNNPNLAAGLPVRNCEFVVRGREAVVAATQNLLDGGEFETASKKVPSGWDWIDGFGQSTSLDMNVKHSGISALWMHDFDATRNSGGNCRIVKRVALKPFHEYRLSLWVKTDELQADEFKFMPLSVGEDGQLLNHANLGVQPTQDWTRHRIVFNSLQHTDVNLYLGLWGAHSGNVWMDDVQLEDVGGINLLRRDGCPIRVGNADGSVKYEEGRDFERWEDPSLGCIPYLGEFDDDHDEPTLRLTANSRIADGDPLRISFYHTVIVHDGQVCASLMADEVFALLRHEVERLNEFLKPARFFMSHDEIRVAGWDELAQGRSTGQLLAENVTRCTTLIRQVSPHAEVLVWSDMFDPHHNAHDNYYLVHGTLAGSWEGLDSSVTIINWNGDRAKSSLGFFADRGHQQIVAGYYDDDVADNVDSWKRAATKIKGVNGFMYTTWRQNYDALEAFAERVEATQR